MSDIEYSLFRVKMIRPHQLSFLHEDLTPREAFLKAIKQKPSEELRKGYIWHIGNLSLINPSAGYFALGRTTTSTIEKYDTESSNFIEDEQEFSPYTHCIFDAKIGFIGIAKKTNLCPTTIGIAERLEELLSLTHVAVENAIKVEIRPIPNPDGFLKSINSARKIYTFSATFGGPNPFDADRFFQKPLSVYLSAANGQYGRTTIRGEDLDKETLTEVTRSTAATGNEASARIQRNRGEKAITIHLTGDPIKIKYDSDEHYPEQVLTDLNKIYESIRHDENIRD